MKVSIFIIGLLVLCLSGCATEPATPTVDIAGTIAVRLASEMLTQTAAAIPPTPLPSPTPLPATPSPIPIPTDTPAPPIDPSNILIEVIGANPNPMCWSGPGSTYTFISNINSPKTVRLLGIGSEPGWVVIKNPYFNNLCWLPESAVTIDPAIDLSVLPVVYPDQTIYEIPQ